ncbi:hypothetical protein FA13DRAFT_1740363 [Coprinellus micaceus]|uniref:Uncharacterized protein n=1 Tax=Coprinellus micaceus TaxID=71717 RepID=A0A4Y7SP78_COPMI|nr:hypothetical protein FA13DRAFT_1740363 [Coprinellus micaceus]
MPYGARLTDCKQLQVDPNWLAEVQLWHGRRATSDVHRNAGSSKWAYGVSHRIHNRRASS